MSVKSGEVHRTQYGAEPEFEPTLHRPQNRRSDEHSADTLTNRFAELRSPIFYSQRHYSRARSSLRPFSTRVSRRSSRWQFDHLITFPAVLTVRHPIDEESPLFGMTSEDFRRLGVRIMASIVGVDTVIVAPVQSHSDYYYDQIKWDRRFVESIVRVGNTNGQSTMAELTKPKILIRFRF